ncbi:hypothetical protein [Paenibacillus sp. FSL M7-0420]|uniref:hypothetical protein n=1 Tax=Paenibacillus sp. FSL M7-0420 TaxID=2921609 RepID=UPI0030FCA4E8
MASVTQRVEKFKQPYGGFLSPNDFTKTVFDDGIELYSEENIYASLVGIAVDYLIRFMTGTSAEEAFKISLIGSQYMKQENKAKEFIKHIKGLDDQSIIYTCKLVGYDVCARVGTFRYKPVEDINPDENTVSNIRTMVNRSLSFWEHSGPIIKEGFTFELAYTPTITCGDGDYLTEDTLWDLKVSKNSPTSTHTLQLLVYYILGLRSIHLEFQNIKKLGIYNPRLNIAYLLENSKIDSSLIKEVATYVVGVHSPLERVETHMHAKEWVIVSPDGKTYRCSNLKHWLREHEHLLDGTVTQASDGIRKIKYSLQGKRKNKSYHWKGWQLLEWGDN